jgi:tRNA-uridine 2-sulfurtransferase
MKIAVGISGGVDSSVAAYLLKKEGHEIIGIWMDLFGKNTLSKDAEKVANYLKIPFYKINLQSEYKKNVISYIKEVYSFGKTPNPCVMCNRRVKFGLFIEKALSSGIEFDLFATGHYSIITHDKNTDRYLLKKGVHEGKDQAYFLSMLSQFQLSRILFPLGGKTKPEVREIAKNAGLFTTQKRESQDLCSGDYRAFISNSKGAGNFIDKDGTILGLHKGIENYTIGQRRGLGISSNKKPYYVIAINPDKNEIILGFNNDLLNKGMIVSDCNWISTPKPKFPITVSAKIRYRDNGAMAELNDGKNGIVTVIFQEERRAVTPGQVAVFYENDSVVGAGIIERGF